MLRQNLCSIILVLGLVAGQAVAGTETGRSPAQIGEKAPDFKLPTADGKQVSLSDYKGKIVVLEWTNHQCPVVGRYVAQKKTMQQTFARFKDKGVAWLAVDSSHFCADKTEAIKEHMKKHGIDYPILLDPEGKVGHMYGAKTTPHMFVIDKDGVLAYAGSMDDDRYGTQENVRPYVAEAISALVNGSTLPVSKTRPFGCSVKYKKNK